MNRLPSPPARGTAPRPAPAAELALLKAVIALYFWLLLLEGVLRKWVFPGLSDALFLVRDPVVVLSYGLALRAGLFPLRPAVLTLGVLAIASVAFSLFAEAPPLVVLFGLHTDYLHLPFIFVMAAALDRDDVRRFGHWTMVFAVPVVLLMLAQFKVGPDHWLNVGAGGGEGGQLRGAMGKIRPPGPFSFISGPVVYFSLVAAFVSHGWIERTRYRRGVLWLATLATIMAVPVSISRSLLLGVLIVLAFAGAAVLRNLRLLSRVAGPAIAAAAFLALSFDTIYVQAFMTRWDEAADPGSGGLYVNVIERLIGSFTQPFALAAEVPFFGHGIGMGTMAGARLMTGQNSFLLAESELGRIVMELGPVLGMAFIGWRVWLAGRMISGGWRRLQGQNDGLSWLLAGATFFNVLVGQWGQTTQLGFAVFGAGLTLAALHEAPGAAPAAAGRDERGGDLRMGWGRR